MLVFTLGAQILPYLAKCSCLLMALLSVLLAAAVSAHVANNSSIQAAVPVAHDPNLVLVNKCCEKFEIHVNNTCQQVNQTGKLPKPQQISGMAGNTP